MEPYDPQKHLKEIEKENRLLKKKLSLCIAQREDIENVMQQTKTLLESVLKEEIFNQLIMFKKFVPQEFLTALNKKNILDIHLGDHVEKEISILFSDIRSFTTLSEQMTPEVNFNFINDYLKNVEPCIYNNDGFIDKFIGDATMALFFHPNKAIDAGIAIQHSLDLYNKERVNNSIPIQIGIGVHTGQASIGIIGGIDRMQSTVISDAVNIASRIETLTKQFGCALLTSGITLSRLTDNKYNCRFLGKVKVSGKKEDITIYDVIDSESPDIAELKLKSKVNMEAGIGLFFERKFAKASVEFTAVLETYPSDKAALFYLRLCSEYMINGVPDHWEGTIVLQNK